MTDKHPSPLRLEPPALAADEALGERLALLARASTPTRVRRRTAWRAPVAGLAIVAATGGLAYGAQSVVHHITTPSVVVPGQAISPSASPTSEQADERITDLPSAAEPEQAPSDGHRRGQDASPSSERSHHRGASHAHSGHGTGVHGRGSGSGKGTAADRGSSTGRGSGSGSDETSGGTSGGGPGSTGRGSDHGSGSGSGDSAGGGSGTGHGKSDERREVPQHGD